MITEHASTRATQRGIPRKIVETIFMFGAEQPAPGRTVRISLDRASILLAAEDNPRLQSKLERYRDAYLVVGAGGRVITVARRRRCVFH